MQAADFSPLPLEETSLDWQILSKNPDGSQEVLVIAAPRVLVLDLIELIKKAGFTLTCIETKPFSTARAILKPQEKEGIAIVDIGAVSSSISIFDSGLLKFTTTAAWGSDLLTTKLKEVFRINNREAEKRKKEFGISKKAPLKQKEILEKNLAILAKEISQAISYYENRIGKGKKIEKIYLSGGGGALPGLGSFLSKEVGIKTEMGKIWGLPDCPLSFANAIGLALREILS